MKKLIRFSILAAFAAVNLALFAVPADAGRNTRICLTEDGMETTCCVWCWILCTGCVDDSDDDDTPGVDGGAN